MIKFGRASLMKRWISNSKMEDWQYMNSIQNSLKHNKIADALSNLENSSSEGVILDIQTFRNLHHKMEQLNSPYQEREKVYSLYRKNFKPNLLMLECMNYLSNTENPLPLLLQDYKQLGIEMPPFIQSSQPKKEQTTNNDKQAVKSDESVRRGRNISLPKFGELPPKIQKQQTREDKEMLDPEEVKRMIEALMGHYSKVVVHNVEIACENFVEDNEGQNNDFYDDQYENYNGEGDPVEHITSISKIKIGKIQIFGTKNPNKDGDEK